jgi:quercetin 2,3-dioxygenase
VVLFTNGGESVDIDSPPDGAEALELLVIGSAPLREPIVRYGPFVMNTKEEIAQAIHNYQSGTLGQLTGG